MTVAYRIYSNHGTGGQIDYSAPIATSSGLTYTTSPLGVSTDTTFVVRAYDPGTGLEQAGREAQARVVIQSDGTDVSGLPNAPHALWLSPAINGGARVTWAYAPAETWGSPTGFNVYLMQGTTVNYSSAVATVPYTPGQVGYSCLLVETYAFAIYTAAVRSFNATGTETNTVTATVLLGAPAPFAMDPVQVTTGLPGS